MSSKHGTSTGNEFDTKTLVLTRKLTKEEKERNAVVEKRHESKPNDNKNAPVASARKLEQNEVGHLPTAGEMGKEIQKARAEKKLTQDQLAQKCNLNVAIIKSYENGTAIVKQQELSLINKQLGLKLHAPRMKVDPIA